MKVGTLCYATEQGLGLLARSFVRAGVVTHPFVVRHTSRPTHADWYPSAPSCNQRSKFFRQMAAAHCRSVDVMVFFETPFDWALLEVCRAAGVKTVLMPMHECMPAVLPALPDLIINPSHLDQWRYPQGVHIPVPVEADLFPWARRERALTFVHNAGHGGLRGRNGTAEVLEACRLLKSAARVIVRSQETLKFGADSFHRLERTPAGFKLDGFGAGGTVPREELYADGDVFLFPEKFNGLSLPLQEAHASGLVVMCGDRFPMNQWLPREPLIPVAGYAKAKVGPPYMEFDEARFDPGTIAETIDAWYGRDVTALSERGRDWAAAHSWAALRPAYLSALRGL